MVYNERSDTLTPKKYPELQTRAFIVKFKRRIRLSPVWSQATQVWRWRLDARRGEAVPSFGERESDHGSTLWRRRRK